MRELTELGLGPALAATGIATSRQAHFDRHGGLIWSEPRGRGLGYAWPQYSIHRGELQMILLAAVRERLGEKAVMTGTKVTGFTERDGAVEVLLSGRPNEVGLTLEADALIGADGLQSAVRARLHPDEPPPRWNGVMMWRGAAEGPPFLSGSCVAIAGSTTSVKFVAYPIARRGAGRVLINWVAEVMMGGAEPPVPAGLAQGGAARRGAAVLQGLDVRLAGRPGPDEPLTGDPSVPDGGPRPAAVLGTGPGDPGGRRGAPDVPDRVERRVTGDRRRPGAGPVAVAVGFCAGGLAAYEAERLAPLNKIVLANRSMPVDAVLDMVSARAPGGFERIEDVLSAAELAALRDAYRATSLQDVAALNARPSLMP